MIYIYPYHKASKSAWDLLEALNNSDCPTRIIKLKGSKFNWNSGKKVINWGNGNPPPGPCLNRYTSIATNKLKAFKKLQEANVSIPEFTTSLQQAQAWLTQGCRVLARTKIASSEGEGIVDLQTAPNTSAPLYVKYIKKAREFRLHTFKLGGLVLPIRTQEKLRKNGEQSNIIRNTANGYVFCNPVSTVPTQVIEQGIRAISALELDFGAVDIIWNNHQQRAYVLEVNTAPGIEGSTITAYANAIKSYYQNNQ